MKPVDVRQFMKSLLIQQYPEVKAALEGLSPVYAKVIFYHRVQQGLTQQELATKANVEYITITRAEGGFDSLPTETYDKIFAALGLHVKDVAKAMMELQSGEDELAATL